MATEIIPGKWADLRSTVASKGLSLSTTAARAPLPFGTDFISLVGTTYSTAVVSRILLNPWLIIKKTADLLVTEPTDYSKEAQDGSTSTSVTLSSLDTFANGDALYVGSHVPFGGVHVDVDAANGTASVLTVKYSKNDGTWADISATDNSASGGATFGQDGTIVWTVPTDWEQRYVANLGGPQFWTRWEVSAALDSSTTLDHMLSINRSSGYIELPTGLPWEQGVLVGSGGVSHVEAVTDAGTALLLVNCATKGRFA